MNPKCRYASFRQSRSALKLLCCQWAGLGDPVSSPQCYIISAVAESAVSLILLQRVRRREASGKSFVGRQGFVMAKSFPFFGRL